MRGRLATIAYALLGVAMMAAVWLGVRVLWEPPDYLLPGPPDVFAAMAENIGVLATSTWITLHEILLGFVVATALGLAAAIGLHLWPRLGRILWSFVLFLQITPQVAFAPLLIAWFGIGLVSKVVLAGVIAFFPVLINTYIGLKSIDQATEDLARSMRVSRLRYLRSFELPHALPDILSGMKIAISYGVVGAVVAEFLSSNQGLGNLILVANGALDASLAIATVIVLSLLGVALYGVMSVAEGLLVPWHVGQRRHIRAKI
jgi:NitT/TauT family transport system permease protein